MEGRLAGSTGGFTDRPVARVVSITSVFRSFLCVRGGKLGRTNMARDAHRTYGGSMVPGRLVPVERIPQVGPKLEGISGAAPSRSWSLDVQRRFLDVRRVILDRAAGRTNYSLRRSARRAKGRPRRRRKNRYSILSIYHEYPPEPETRAEASKLSPFSKSRCRSGQGDPSKYKRYLCARWRTPDVPSRAGEQW